MMDSMQKVLAIVVLLYCAVSICLAADVSQARVDAVDTNAIESNLVDES